MPTSLIAPIVSAGASYGLGKLLGSGKQEAPVLPPPSGFDGGGLTSSFNQGTGNFEVRPTAQRLGVIGGLRETFGNQAGELGGLQSQVQPGYNDLLNARLEALNNARTSAIGNLRENLSRRRVLGSSFGQDAISRGNAEFAKLQDQIVAQNKLQSISATNELINQKYQAHANSYNTALSELNFEANAAMGLASKGSQQIADNAKFMANYNYQANAAEGSAIGGIFGPVASALGKSVGGFFGNGVGGSLAPTGSL
jgi:hypothetical protein